ncbi:hypothetical protein [Amycolatopsis jejuensis]|uniref:hypothetical protein n=1 Tax=Amycolatopsis jejuensis TaxID=330084 RepID=UPI0005244813|nr:hypothetical protein [Amycolatopsis jejuensis]
MPSGSSSRWSRTSAGYSADSEPTWLLPGMHGGRQGRLARVSRETARIEATSLGAFTEDEVQLLVTIIGDGEDKGSCF